MQRLYAASCFILAVIASAAYLRGSDSADLKVVQGTRWTMAGVMAQEPSPVPNSSSASDTKPNAPAPDTKPGSPAGDKKPEVAAPGSLAQLTIDVDVIEQAKAGDKVAQYKLGYDYYLGRGIAQDYVQAAVWWKKSADQGFPSAQNNLGVLYNAGKGVPQSYSEAYFWQNLAAARANGKLQAQFAKNRDDSAARISYFERLRVQKRAAKWAVDHPVAPRSHEPPVSQP